MLAATASGGRAAAARAPSGTPLAVGPPHGLVPAASTQPCAPRRAALPVAHAARGAAARPAVGAPAVRAGLGTALGLRGGRRLLVLRTSSALLPPSSEPPQEQGGPPKAEVNAPEAKPAVGDKSVAPSAQPQPARKQFRWTELVMSCVVGILLALIVQVSFVHAAVAFAVDAVSQNMFSFVAAIASTAILLLYRLSSSSERQKEVTTDLKADAAEREARLNGAMTDLKTDLKADTAEREARLKADAAEREARLKADATEREARLNGAVQASEQRLSALIIANMEETKASEARTETRIFNSQQTVRDVTAAHAARAQHAAQEAASHAAQAKHAAQAAQTAAAAQAARVAPPPPAPAAADAAQ
jgi:hypothetical protein